MKRFLCACLALVISSAANLCSAAVFERDWKTPGDGLLTFDDVNQRVWLDLSESRLDQFPGSTTEQQYQNAILELQAGGHFEGFTVAKIADVMGLAQSAGIDTTTLYYATNLSPTSNLIDLLSLTSSLPNGHVWSLGLLDEFPTNPPIPIRLAAQFDLDPHATMAFGQAGLRFGGFDPISYRGAGVLLYRNVPEPTSAALMLIGAFHLMSSFRS